MCLAEDTIRDRRKIMRRDIMIKSRQTASMNKRVMLDSSGKIVDKVHPEYSAETPCYMDPSSCKPYRDQQQLRSGLFLRRLEQLIPKLTKGNGRKRQTRAFYDELPELLLSILEPSQLNRRAGRTSLRKPFRGKLRHRKTELQELTSISLFIDDVERLLRDLYGDVDSDRINDLVAAMKLTTLTLSSYLLPDLRAEHNTAFLIDRGAGRCLPPGDGVSTCMLTDGVDAAKELIGRVRAILSSANAYGRYTVGSANALRKYWPAVREWRRPPKTVPAAIASLLMRCKHVNAVRE
jgi:hypothetical protein